MEADSYHGFTLLNSSSPGRKKKKPHSLSCFFIVNEVLLCKLKSQQIKEFEFKRNGIKNIEKEEGRKHVTLQKQTNLEVTEKSELQ